MDAERARGGTAASAGTAGSPGRLRETFRVRITRAGEIARRALEVTRRGAVTALVAVLRFYRRWISPLFPPQCRFYPSCSAYAIEALQVHGAARGVGLTLVRLVKCAPWHPGGLDPVPLPRVHRHPDTSRSGPAGSGADRTPTPDPGAAAPITEEQASC